MEGAVRDVTRQTRALLERAQIALTRLPNSRGYVRDHINSNIKETHTAAHWILRFNAPPAAVARKPPGFAR